MSCVVPFLFNTLPLVRGIIWGKNTAVYKYILLLCLKKNMIT